MMDQNYLCPKCQREVPIGRECPSHPLKSKGRIIISIFSIAVLLAFSVVYAIEKGQPATIASPLDLEKLKRVTAQLQVLQMQAQPLGVERNEIYLRNCAAAHVAVQECNINTETGEISSTKPPGKK